MFVVANLGGQSFALRYASMIAWLTRLKIKTPLANLGF